MKLIAIFLALFSAPAWAGEGWHGFAESEVSAGVGDIIHVTDLVDLGDWDNIAGIQVQLTFDSAVLSPYRSSPGHWVYEAEDCAGIFTDDTSELCYPPGPGEMCYWAVWVGCFPSGAGEFATAWFEAIAPGETDIEFAVSDWRAKVGNEQYPADHGVGGPCHVSVDGTGTGVPVDPPTWGSFKALY